MGQIILGVGSGRCGTLTLAHQLSRFTGVKAYHEGVAIPDNDVGLGHMFQVGHCGKITDAQTRWNRRVLNKRILHSARAAVFVDVAFYFSQNLDLIAEMIPDVKLIHLRRPQEEVAASFIRKNAGRSLGMFEDGGRHTQHKGNNVWTSWCDSFGEYLGCDLQKAYNLHWYDCEAFIKWSSLPRLTIESQDLSKLNTWKKISEWIGIPIPEGFNPDLRMNATRP